jgi:FKBP-type peptidyl-prolyl cis-trans isomerase FklB
MKKFLFLLVVVAAVNASAQKTPPKVVPKTNNVLKNGLDSFSYALGISIANFYKEQGVSNANTTVMVKAINDIIKGGKPLLSPDQANFVLNDYLNKLRDQKALGNKKKGKVFLDANGKRQGVITTPSGLQYEIIKQGTGVVPKATDTVKVHYHGTLIDGRIFDSSVDRGEPIHFPVGGVIQGWVEALQLMPVGSKWKLYVPAQLAYGSGAPPGSIIEPGSTLIFEVELLGIGSK